jgi:hypothetical protein
MPVPASRKTVWPGTSTWTQEELPPIFRVEGPGTGILPRTPRKVRMNSWADIIWNHLNNEICPIGTKWIKTEEKELQFLVKI